MVGDQSKSGSDRSRQDLLEIELRRIRNEASAARLEAQAARIELILSQLRSGQPSNPNDTNEQTTCASLARVDSVPQHHAESNPHFAPPQLIRPSAVTPVFSSWDAVRLAQGNLPHAQPLPTYIAATDIPPKRHPTTADSAPASENRRLRFDGPSTPRHHLQPSVTALPDETNHNDVELAEPIINDPQDNQPGSRSGEDHPIAFLSNDDTSQPDFCDAGEVHVDGEEPPPDRAVKKSRPMAFIVSTAVHIAVLVMLGMWTLSSHRPKDQVALSASSVPANEVSMETFSLEAAEPEVEPTESTQSETQYELSPMGEVAVAELSPDMSSALTAPPTTNMLSSSSSAAASAAAMSVNSTSDAKIQFCGVEGGGNHFVYLVDSSGSMGDGFDSARNELLQSIEFLKPDQRFYVIFFDAEPDFMRLTSNTEDEPRSVEATAENKQLLRRWALRIRQDRGKNPYEVLEFALQLRPDVIFLLSDGEFPQKIEDLLKEKNRVDNLFGDSHPMCIVHTIAYFSEEGESRMRRIAQQNGGQYRYIPPPGK